MVNDLDDGGGTVPEASAPAPPADFSAPLNYPAASLKETFAKNAQKFRACYLPGKKRDGKLRGKVIVKFTINTAGRSTFAANEGSNLPDDAVIACVVRLVKSLRYAKPDEGTVTVIYPFIFRPWEETVILPESAPAK
jgi:outer membrane biosynthesis protein TonB